MSEDLLIEEFYKRINNEEIWVSKCKDCDKLSLPPRKICPYCNSVNTSWEKIKNEGTVESYTIIHVAPKLFEEEAPYYVCLIKLDGKLNILAKKKYSENEKINIGDKVRIKVAPNKYNLSWPLWPILIFEKIS
jgi:Predicted nucleic-acid-binding protein containing a Zn-ribbon